MADEHMKADFAAFEILRAVDPDTEEARKLRVEDDGNNFFGLRVALYQWVNSQWARYTPPAAEPEYKTIRIENDVDGYPLYRGVHETFQADPDDTNWEVEKFTGWFTANYLQEGPVTGAWNNRTNLF